jgi:hypothetical protein
MSVDKIELTPVFRLKPNRLHPDDGNQATSQIKFVDYITESQKLGDEPIDLKVSEKVKEMYNTHTDYIGNIDKYDIKVSAYRNNMTGNYMISTKIMPISSLNFMYSKNIVIGFLFNIYLYFILDGLKNHFLKDPKSYVGATIYGDYMIFLETENELKYNELEKRIEKYATEDVAQEITEKNLELSETEILDMINKNIEEKKTFYKSLFNGIKINSFKTIQKIYDDYLIPIYKNKHINGLIKFGLEMRQLKRQKEYGVCIDEYKIPNKILKISDYKDNPELIDKYLGIDEDSSDED